MCVRIILELFFFCLFFLAETTNPRRWDNGRCQPERQTQTEGDVYTRRESQTEICSAGAQAETASRGDARDPRVPFNQDSTEPFLIAVPKLKNIVSKSCLQTPFSKNKSLGTADRFNSTGFNSFSVSVSVVLLVESGAVVKISFRQSGRLVSRRGENWFRFEPVPDPHSRCMNASQNRSISLVWSCYRSTPWTRSWRNWNSGSSRPSASRCSRRRNEDVTRRDTLRSKTGRWTAASCTLLKPCIDCAQRPLY